MSKLKSLLLFLTMLLALPASALENGEDFEYEGILYTVIDAEAKTVKTREGNFSYGVNKPGNYCEGDVTIPAIVSDGTNDYKVVEIGDYAFASCDGLTSINLPDGVTSIGKIAFWGCSNLSAISLPNSVTTIGNSAFTNCTSLTSITIPEGVTNIELDTFLGCSGLTSITIPDSVTFIGERAFSSSGLTSITIPVGVTMIENRTFEGCSNLTSISLPEGVTAIGEGAFFGCSNLSSINLPDGLSSIGPDAFMGCSSLTSISLPNSLTTISDGAFMNCTSLTSIEIPNSVTTIEDGAFMYCTSLTSIDIQNGVKKIERNAFTGCSSLTSITIPESMLSIGMAAFENTDPNVEVTYLAENPIESYDDIFSDGSYNTGVLKMPNASIAAIQAISPWNKFQHIIAKDGTIEPGLASDGDFEYEGVWYTILDAETLTVKTKDGYSDDASYHAGNTYEGDLVIPALVSDGTQEFSVVKIGDFAFVENSLTSLTLPETVTSIGKFSFFGCRDLTTVKLPNYLENIGVYAFHSCSALTSIELPNTLKEISQNVFTECTVLTDLEFPNSLTSIGSDAFRYCNGLTNVVLPESLTSIGWSAFRRCENLSAITLPASLASIEGSAFSESNITTITYYAKNPLVCSDNIFDETTYENATLNMPNANQSAIQQTTPWNLFKNVNSGGSPDLAAGDDFEYEGFRYTVVDAEAKTVMTKEGVNSEDGMASGNTVTGDLVIPAIVTDSNTEYSVVEIGVYGFAGCGISSISLPESVSRIADGAFFNCSDLTSVSLSEGLTSIGEMAFSNCQSLTDLSLPESLKAIKQFAFSNCSNLSRVSLPSSLEELGEYVFNVCHNIKDVNYGASTLIEAPENIFEDDVYAVAPLNTPNASLASVQATVPWNMFGKIVASDGSIGFGAGSGEDFEYEGFWYTVLDSEAKTCKTKDGARRVGDTTFAPDYCTPGNVVEGEVRIPAIVSDGTQDYSVVEIGYLGFINSSNITDVVIPESVITIGDYAFYNCANLTTVSLPESLETIKMGAFQKCINISAITLPQNLKILGESSFDTCSAIESISIPESVNSIGGHAFDGCTSLKTVTLPASMPACSFELFMGSKAITDVTYLASTPVQCSSYLFDNDTYGVATLHIPNATLASVKSTVPWMSFKRIIASDGSVLPSENEEDFEDNGLWYTVIDTEAKTCRTKAGGGYIDGNLVYGNRWEGIGRLTIPSSASDGFNDYTVVEIGDYSFAESPGMTTVIIPESVTWIGMQAFNDCPSFGYVELPEGVVHVGEMAFSNCPNLSTVAIPASITTIDSGAFASCSSTMRVTYNAAEPIAVSESAFEGSYESGTLIAPNATIESIRTTVPWNRFLHITASDGVYEPGPGIGEQIEADGITYVVTDADNNFVKIMSEGLTGNVVEGDLLIPSTIESNGNVYTVTEIGDFSFQGNPDLRSVTIPGTVTSIGNGAFTDCERLTSIVWLGDTQMPNLSHAIDNPNMLIYVNDKAYAPADIDHNIVAAGICDNLVLTPGYAFTPLKEFTSDHSEMTMSFTQQTPVDGCAGWETLALPFQPISITTSDGRDLVPFQALKDIATQCPFWLYEADEAGEWKLSSDIRQSVAYILSMPNNDNYDPQYRVDGPVKFVTNVRTVIAPETCVPYVTTWNSGREFRSLWLPLTEAEAAEAMGLNVGISDLTDDNGELLAPGSAFCADVLPLPMEAYVTRIDGRRAMPVRGGQSLVAMMDSDEGLRIATDLGEIVMVSDRDRMVDVFTMDGIVIRRIEVKAGVVYRLENLTRGLYIVAGRKITVK